VGVFNYKDIYCEMKQLIRHILREHTREIGEYAKSTTSDFIKKAEQVHGDKYDYSETEYNGNHKKVKIICPIHGEFEQTPANHLTGNGCKECGLKVGADKNRKKLEDFINNAKKVHGNKYNYSLVDYKTNKTKVKIICPIHGEFEQRPQNHLGGEGCKECGYDKVAKKLSGLDNPNNTLEKDFIKNAKVVHNNKYNYSKVNYTGLKKKVNIICPIHGEFEQTPQNHLSGDECPKCASITRGKNIGYDTEEFIDRAKKIHGNKYDYSLVDYKDGRTKVIIICPIHGEFLQQPFNHINGNGCPICQESKGEKFVTEILKKYNINHLKQHKFIDCTNKLKGGVCRKLPFDFYIPTKNVCIEYDGRQHYEPIIGLGGEEAFKTQKIRDKIKNQYCKKNGIKLIRIPYTMKKEDVEPYILKELGIQ
jgi:hypothetical protein